MACALMPLMPKEDVPAAQGASAVDPCSRMQCNKSAVNDFMQMSFLI